MKKLLKSLFVLALFVVTGFAVVACDKAPKMKSIYVDLNGQQSISVAHNSNWNPKEELVVKAVLSDKTEKTLNSSDCTFTGVNTNNVGEQTLIVSYGAYKCEVKVNVYKVIESIGLVNGSISSTVNHNETLDLSQAKVNVTWSNGDIDYNIAEGITFSDTQGNVIQAADTSAIGAKKIMVNYQGESCEFNYEVVKTIKSLVIDDASYATEVDWGSTYNYQGVTATVTYSDNTTDQLVSSEFTVVKELALNEQGKRSDFFTIKFGDKTANSNNVNIKVYYKELVYVSGIPEELEGGLGLNKADVVAKVKLTDNSLIDVVNDNLVLSYNFNKYNQDNTVTLSYQYEGQTKTTTTDVYVWTEFKNEISFVDNNGVRSYYVVTEDGGFNKENFTYYERHSGEYKVEITDLSRLSFEEVDRNSDSVKDAIKITYNKEGDETPYYAYINVTFIDYWYQAEFTVAEVEILNYADVIAQNATYGNDELSQLKIEVTYTNGIVVEYDYDEISSELTIPAVDTSNLAGAKLSVSYGSVSVEANIAVKRTMNAVMQISEGSVSSTKYNAQNPTDFLKNLKFAVQFSSGTETVSINDVRYTFSMPSAEEFQTAGSNIVSKTITFYFDAPSDCFDTSVVASCQMTFNVEGEEIKIIAEGAQTEVNYDDDVEASYDLSAIKVYLAYTGGYNKLITNELTKEKTTGAIIGDASGYIFVNTIALSIPGPQLLYINYYNFDGEDFELTYSLVVSVLVKDVVTGYEIVGVNQTVQVNGEVNYNSMALKPIYKSGYQAGLGEYVTDSQNFVYEQVDVTTAGVKTLTVTYQGKQAEIEITVVDNIANYTVLNFTNPASIETYETNNKEENKNAYTATNSSGKKGFNVVGNLYVVGDDNNFKFSPILKVKYDGDDKRAGILETYELGYQLALYNELNSSYDEYLSDPSTYIDNVDVNAHTFDFSQNAVGNRFKLKVWPTKDSSKYLEFEFRVIDAYNVYNAKEFSIWDNRDGDDKWTRFLGEEYKGETVAIAGIVLHNNITITREDIPTEHFHTSETVKPGDADADLALGSMKDAMGDSPYRYVYTRILDGDQQFNVEGNYFTVDYSKMPLIVRQDNGTIYGKINSDGSAITTHVSMFNFFGPTTVKEVTAENTEQVYVNNVSWFGNAKKSENTALSGGVIGVQAIRASTTIYNNIAQASYIAYFFSNAEEFCENNKMRLHQTNGFDAYNTLLYVWGAKEVYIDSCNLIGAGGPVMILDHVGNDEDTGAGGYPTNVYVDKLKENGDASSVLESWIAGTEGWFQTYSGSGAIVSSLKPIDALLQAYGKTMLDNGGQKMNLVAVFKSGSAEGLTTSTIRGSFTVNGYQKGLDLADSSLANMKAETYQTVAAAQGGDPAKIAQALAGMCIIESYNAIIPEYNPTGANMLGVPYTQETPWLHQVNHQALAMSGDYMNIYLFNGMAAVVGLEPKA